MSISILVILFFIAFLLHENKPIVSARRQLWFFRSTFLFLVLLFSIGTGFIPRLIINNLAPFERVASPSWGNKNAIIVLGQGVQKWEKLGEFTTSSFGMPRLLEAQRLYQLCKTQNIGTCSIIVSGGDPLKKGITESQVMAQDLINVGVSEADIIQEAMSNNTFKNAEYSFEILKRENFDKIILVTSGFHLKRSILYFKYFLDNFDYSAADKMEIKLSLIPMAYNFMMMDLAIHEYLGIGRFYYYNFIGANKKATSN